MPGLLPDVDPDGLLEYSVVYTDRSLNHMSQRFQGVMRDISTTLKQVYQAHSAVIVPGSGTFGMEAAARQFATGKHCLVIRNGQFSYRWSQILEMGAIPDSTTVLKARRIDPADPQSPFAPAPIEEVERTIQEERPAVVFAPHVETSAGILLPDDYLKRIAAAVHAVGGLFVLDCIASGTLWVDMREIGVDVLLSAPQKGWSGLPCCGMVMLSELARERIEETTSTSFACDLRKWLTIMETYENGGHAYHATMPTDGLARLRDIMEETAAYGFDRVREEQWALGEGVRSLMANYGYRSVAAAGFEAPGVVVCYTRDPGIAGKFAGAGIQVAGGVPLMCDEGEGYQAFRIGLFGLDKLHHLERSLANLEAALRQVD
ncbi:aminotransferase class V-fold PLP-dependent enzyme [Billgrantia montanilacus]|uniref:Alanine--glyoxylate aminotransferase family protein n=1 Tax=Billgrantia montanilacus TaxID=2282305 RepID=A0A368TQX8_9GAMM|nr:aminotransferase class V-fold PLP-dependent enzyme [Halomonas montanilacus]RCV86542.1 alanine--glyoxylate aminotransferase family protein [Halomonas montanilacus]